MAELKTRPTQASVAAFLKSVEDDEVRADCRTLLKLIKKVTRAEPKMWGPGLVGFGSYHYRYATGREGDWPVAGFSPRKRELTVYIMAGFERYEALLAKLGRHRTGKSCLYVKRLADVDLKVLEALVTESVRYVKAHYDKPARKPRA